MSIVEELPAGEVKILSVFLFIMGQTVRMLRQRITGITYKTQTWKTDLPIIMCAAMESYRRKMTKIALGTADT